MKSSKKLEIIYNVTVRYINKTYYNYLKYSKNELYKNEENKRLWTIIKEIDNKYKYPLLFRHLSNGIYKNVQI